MFQIDCKRSIADPDAILALVLREYDLSLSEVASCCLLSYGINDVFLIEDLYRKFIFRIYPAHWKPENYISSEIQVLNYCRQKMAVHKGIPNKHDQTIISFEFPEGIRYGILLTYSFGSILPLDVESVTSAGQHLAEFHQEADLLQTQLKGVRLACNELNDEFFFKDSVPGLLTYIAGTEAETLLVHVTERLREGLIDLYNQISRCKSPKPRYGLCHGDVHHGNMVIDVEPSLIDFDLLGYGFRAYDIATFIWKLELTITERDIRLSLIMAFIQGYQKVRRLSEEELSSIILFIQCRHIYWLGMQVKFVPSLFGEKMFSRNFFVQQLKRLTEWNSLYHHKNFPWMNSSTLSRDEKLEQDQTGYVSVTSHAPLASRLMREYGLMHDVMLQKKLLEYFGCDYDISNLLFSFYKDRENLIEFYN